MKLKQMSLKTLELWTKKEYFDTETRQELLKITDPKEVEDRFYKNLEFGTGGMRGLLGAGTKRMNKYVLRKVTQALADAIRDHGQEVCQRGLMTVVVFPETLPLKQLWYLQLMKSRYIFLEALDLHRSFLLRCDICTP